jgi:phenylpyruvate tautomerase PptA (4-oxalocrotonate tautomerase family)
MPFIHIYTTETVDQDVAQKLTANLSSIASEVLGKSENYVMVAISPAIMRMSNVPDQAVFVDVRAIGGLTPDTNRTVSERVCELLESELNIPRERMFLNFSDVPGTDWGWAGRTFG